MTRQDTTEPSGSVPATKVRIRWRNGWLAVVRSPVSAGYVGRRAISALVAAWGALTVVFIMMLAAGNPAEVLAGDDATASQVQALSHEYGFDKPIILQYLVFLKNVITVHFPNSLITDVPAFEVVIQRIPATLELSFSAIALGTAVGIVVGYWSATSTWRRVRGLPLAGLMVLQSVPSFFLGLVLILVFSVTLGWLPATGIGGWQHLLLPLLTLSSYVAPGVARLFRATIRETASEEHVVTATAKGISPRSVQIRHVAVNAMGPVIALIGLQAGGILGGAIITESVFAWPGVGQLLVYSVANRDYPVVLAAVVIICLGYAVSSLLVDIAVAAISPRGNTQR